MFEGNASYRQWHILFFGAPIKTDIQQTFPHRGHGAEIGFWVRHIPSFPITAAQLKYLKHPPSLAVSLLSSH